MVRSETISSDAIAKEAGLSPPQVLVHRSGGAKFSAVLRKWLARLGSSSALVLKLDSAESMDVSFQDEVFGKIARDRAIGENLGARLVLEGLREPFMEEIGIILDSWTRRSKGIGNFVFPVITVENDLVLLGPCETQVIKTFNYIKRSGRATSNDLMDKFGISAAAAGTRLKLLFDLGLVLRESAGDATKQLIYYPPV